MVAVLGRLEGSSRARKCCLEGVCFGADLPWRRVRFLATDLRRNLPVLEGEPGASSAPGALIVFLLASESGVAKGMRYPYRCKSRVATDRNLTSSSKRSKI